MIIDRLIVERYGHFERLELDLGAGRGGLTVIYGDNEAGKSTLLQSVRDLFFGIDDRTPLAFRYDYKSILLRAKLRDSAGQRLDVERRKKRKASLTGTLSSQAGVAEINAEEFAAYFGGVKADLYNALFGFSLENLQRGAVALESAGLKEVLGGSALGGGGDRIASVLADLEHESRDLYRKQGKVRPINRSLTTIKETQQLLRDSTLQQSAYQGLTRRQAEIHERFQSADRDIAALRTRRDRVSLLLRAAADFRELAALDAELAAASEGLTEDEARRARQLLAEASAVRPRLQSLDAELARMEERIASLTVDEALLAEEATVERLGRGLGHLTALRREVPAERAALDAEALRLREEAGEVGEVGEVGDAGDGPPPAPEPPAPDLLLRLRERTGAWREASEAVARASREEQQHRTKIEAARKSLGGAQEEDAADRETIFLASELEELGDRRSQLERIAADKQRAEVELAAALSPFGLRLDADEAAALESPDADDLRRLLGEHTGLEDRARQLAREQARIDTAREAAPERRGGGPKQLAARDALTRIADARARRRSAWEDLRQAWLTGPERITELERYGILRSVEAAIEAADSAADHLRDHADQLARLRAEELEAGELEAAAERLQKDELDLEKERRDWRKRWTALWSALPTGVAPEPSSAMALLRNLDVARGAALRLANARRQETDLRPGLDDFVARLRRHIGQERAGWPLLVKHLRERAAQAQTRRGRRESTRERLAELEAAREHALGDLEGAKRTAAELRDQLRDLLAEVGLAPDLDPELALRRLDRRGLLREQGAALRLRREALAGKEAELAEAEAEAAELLARVGAESEPRSLAAAVDELSRRLSTARGNALARKHTQETLAQRLPLRDQAKDELAEADAELARLRRRSGCADDRELAAAAEHTLQREALEARRRELQGRVEQHLQDAGVPRLVFEGELASSDPEALRAELATIQPRLSERERERTQLAEQRGKLDQEIESLGGDRAARLSAEVQSLLAGLGEEVDRYVLVHVAHRILDAVTERFARESQPAILQQISALLQRITGGRHVRVSADRQAGTLLVHDASGAPRKSQELSTGTREQLFLALRLAYILDYCDRAEPLPVIIDDVLVNFDRGRARSTLQALCEVARSTQVLLFTCHEHIVDLTREIAQEVPVLELPRIHAGELAVNATTLRVDPPRSAPS